MTELEQYSVLKDSALEDAWVRIGKLHSLYERAAHVAREALRDCMLLTN